MATGQDGGPAGSGHSRARVGWARPRRRCRRGCRCRRGFNRFPLRQITWLRFTVTQVSTTTANAGLAHLLIARKQYPEAEALLRKALEQSPGDEALNAQLAAVLAAENKAEALPLLQKLHAALKR